MSKFTKQNLSNIRFVFEEKTGVDLKHKAYTCRSTIRRTVLIAAILALCVTLAAFTYPLFSPLDGDALTLSGSYEGNGIVSIQVENRSHKKLEFQPQTKLVKWITGEEVTPLSDAVVFGDLTVAPHSTKTITLDLSKAYDMALLEQSLFTEWYYLVLTNYNFVFGQEWKCSVYFGAPQLETPPTDEPLFTVDPAIIAQVEEELRYYFEDDYTGLFAANPLHYEYLQKVEELIQRNGKRFVASVESLLMLLPDESEWYFDREYEGFESRIPNSQNVTIQDGFGKLIGSGEHEQIKYLCYYAPVAAPENTEMADFSFCIPLLYYSTFIKSEIQSPEDCTLIHGQILSFAELEPYKVFDNGSLVCYDVTHLFYTDLRAYVEDVVEYRWATNQDAYMDEEIFAEIQETYDHYKAHGRIVTWEDFAKARSACYVRLWTETEELAQKGLTGLVGADHPLKDVYITIRSAEGQTLFAGTYHPENPPSKWHHFEFDLTQAVDANSVLMALPEGAYTIEISARMDTDRIPCRSLLELDFTVDRGE